MGEDQSWQELVQLRRILSQRLDEGELRTLCFDLQVDYEDLPGAGKSNKVRELLSHLARRNRLADLLSVGRESRPDIEWPSLAASDATEPAKTEQLLDHLHEKRAHALSELYGQIVDAESQLRAWAYKDMPVGLPPEVNPAEVMAQVRELARMATKARIYLADETQALVSTAVDEVVATAQSLEQREIMPEGDEGWNAHVAALDRLYESIPPAVAALEQEIRRILGAK